MIYSVYIFPIFCSFLPLVAEKDVKTLKKIILSSEWLVKHLFDDQNTQHPKKENNTVLNLLLVGMSLKYWHKKCHYEKYFWA